MRILFIGSRLYDDVDYYVRKKGIESILTESNEDAINLDLPDQVFIVPRGMDGPKQIAVTQDVDAVVVVLELEHAGGDGDAPLLFQLHPVGDGVTGRGLALDGAGQLNGASVQQQLFR